MPAGKTKDAGWNIGVSKTLDLPLADVWDFVISPAGTALWLGDDVMLEAGASYETTAGVVGEVRSLREGDRVRLTWRPADWAHDSTVQVAVSPAGSKTVLRFHQERLADADERTRQRAHWQQVMAAVVDQLDGGV
ncbi:SRPBCC family protein [Kribbella sp. NPDC002412]